MKINNIQNITFQKQLQAKCTIIKDKKPSPCYIYKIENSDNYAQKLDQDEDWEQGEFKRIIEREDNFDSKKTNYYTIEDENEKCLGWCRVFNEKIALYGNARTLDYIDVLPKYKGYDNNHKKRKRSASRIGQTLIAFLIKKSKKENFGYFFIHSPVHNAIEFYKKCGFKYGKDLDLSDEEKSTIAIDRVQEKTKTTIKLVG